MGISLDGQQLIVDRHLYDFRCDRDPSAHAAALSEDCARLLNLRRATWARFSEKLIATSRLLGNVRRKTNIKYSLPDAGAPTSRHSVALAAVLHLRRVTVPV